MRTRTAGVVLALGLALTGCSDPQDPEIAQVTPEQAREEAARMQEQGVGHGAEAGGAESGAQGSGTGAGAPHAEGESGSGGGTTGSGESGSGSGTPGTGAHGGETGATGAGGTGISDQALAQFEQQFPALAAAVPEQQLRDTATRVCDAIRSGGTAQGQQVVEGLPGVDPGTAQQVVGYFDREVCPR